MAKTDVFITRPWVTHSRACLSLQRDMNIKNHCFTERADLQIDLTKNPTPGTVTHRREGLHGSDATP